MTSRTAETVTGDATSVALVTELPDPVIAGTVVLLWVASGLVVARVMAARGHEFRAVAGLAATMGPLFLPLALDHLRRRDPFTRPVPLRGELTEGKRTVVVLNGPAERAADVLPVLRRLEDPGTLTLAVPVGFSTLRAPEHDVDRRAAEARAHAAAALLADFDPVVVLAPGTPADVVERLAVDAEDIVLAVGAFPTGARASADRLGAQVVVVPPDGSR